MRNQRGYTMIEAVLVAVIVAVMTGVFLTFTDFTNSSLDRATRRLESDLRYAQQLATAEETTCGLTTTGANTYTVYRQTPATPVLDPHTQLPLLVDFTVGYDSVAFGANYQIEFDANGRPSTGGGTQLQLNLNNQNATVTVTATTGYIQSP